MAIAQIGEASLAFDPHSFLKLGRRSFRSRTFNLVGRPTWVVPVGILGRYPASRITVRHFLVLVEL